jgi:2-polyprenyl-3-methyl-5-hydroxy-6-metoxy-1,4-benzoquinol methylase
MLEADMANNLFEESLNPLGYYEATPKPTPQDLSNHYRLKYYQEANGTYSKEYLPEELRYFHNTAQVALETARRLSLNETLYDLGCGEGFFTKSFHDFGWLVSCCDFSEYGISKHNPEMLPFFKAGDIFQSIVERSENGEHYGLINLQNVLEHVIDPEVLLCNLRCLLNQNSAIRIRVPNDYSKFQEALISSGKTVNTWFSPPEHLSYFNKDGLTAIIEKCGYRVVSLQADFPIEVFLTNNHSNYWRDRTLGKQAHLSRVFCENYLIENNLSGYIEYSEAAARLGFGRDLIAYVTIA